MLTGEEDMSIEKPNGKTQAPEPVESIGWFGDVFISSKISGPCTGNVPAKHAKYTKRNPWRGRYTSGLQAQQELTEQTEVESLSVLSVASCSTVPAPLAHAEQLK